MKFSKVQNFIENKIHESLIQFNSSLVHAEYIKFHLAESAGNAQKSNISLEYLRNNSAN